MTWLPEPTSLQLEPTSLDGSTWLPKPTSLDKSMHQDGSTQLTVDTSDGSTWLPVLIRLDGSTLPPEPISLDGLTWPPEPTSLDKSKQVDSSASRHVKIGQLSCHSTRLDWLTWAREPIHLDGSTAVRANTSNGWTWSPKQTCLDGLSSLLEQTSLQLEPTSLDKLTRQNGSTHCHSTRLDGSTWPLEPIRLDGSTLPLEPIRLDWLLGPWSRKV